MQETTSFACRTESALQLFNEATSGTLMEAIKRALIVYSQPKPWKQLQTNGMQKDYSWKKSAKEYMALYAGC